ncbi:hypothetical protein FRC01_008606 [Tulasnella sp. 417]|nr:hypothetical protein FRC01_008606 [Tulasnella sp. 417]
MAELNRNDLNLETHIEQTQDVFSRLPNELVTIIFSYLLFDSEVPLRSHRAPARLIPVCCRFKRIVDESPELWTIVVISERGGFRHLPDYLARSNGMPIDVTLYPLDDQYQNTFLRRAGPILGEKRRWREVVIGMRAPWATLHPLLPTLEQAPLLTRLSIRQSFGAPYEPLDGLDYVVPDYPGVRVLDVSEVCVNTIGIGTTGLQELGVRTRLSNSDAWAAFSGLLNRNPSLRRVKADLPVPEAQDDQPPPFDSSTPISLPSLTSFELRISPTTRLDTFLQTLNAPKLSQLSVKPTIFDINPKADFTGLIATCIKQFNSLKEITLDRYDQESYKIVREDVLVHQLEEIGITVRLKSIGD